MGTLKQNIRKSLKEAKENKRVLVVEEKIIKNRYNIIVESFGKDADVEKLIQNIISETVYLNSQNYNEKLLNENFLDLFKSLLPNLGPALMDMLKEYVAKGIIKGLGMNPDSTFAVVIKNAFANITIEDLPKLVKLDCKYITELVARTTTETIVEQKLKFFKEHDIFGSVLKNTIDSYFRNNFSDEFEKFIGGPICQLLSKFSGKMDDQTDNLRKVVMSAA